MNIHSNRGRPPYEGISPAEARVLEHVRAGRPNAEIAVRLGISTSAVKYHVSNLLAKSGLDSRGELAHWQPRRGRSAQAAGALPWFARIGLGVGGVVAVVGVAAAGTALRSSGSAASSDFFENGIISVGYDGSAADGGSGPPSISHDGRYVVFDSEATNLVPGDTNGVSDVFLFDRKSAELRRISMGHGGLEADGGSWLPRISGDGSVVVFESEATNLVEGGVHVPTDEAVLDRFWDSLDADMAQVGAQSARPVDLPGLAAEERGFFAHQVYALALPRNEVTIVSVSSDGLPGDIRSASPSVSADGRYVAFISAARNLRPEASAGPLSGFTMAGWMTAGVHWEGLQVYLHDRQSGLTTMLSRGSDGTPGNRSSTIPEITPDGSSVVFWSWASNLAPAAVRFEDVLMNGKVFSLPAPNLFVANAGTGSVRAVPLRANLRDPAAHRVSDLAAWFSARELAPDGQTGVKVVYRYDFDSGLLAEIWRQDALAPGFDAVLIVPTPDERVLALLNSHSALELWVPGSGAEWSASPGIFDGLRHHNVSGVAPSEDGTAVTYTAWADDGDQQGAIFNVYVETVRP